jgi:ABC-type transport system involved in multi-copper enzyme maturation permease subunit
LLTLAYSIHICYNITIIVTFPVTLILPLLILSAGLVNRLAAQLSDKELKQRYLVRMAHETETATLKGIPAGLIAESVRLDEIFIPLQLRPNRPKIDYPLSDAELEHYRQCVRSGVFPKGLDLMVIDAEKNWQTSVARLSPGELYGEVVAVVLDPSVRSTQQTLLASMGLALVERGAIPGELPLLQSVLIVWAQIVSLVAATILLFVLGYVVFQRQEVRA